MRTASDRGRPRYTGPVIASHLRRACAVRRGRLEALLSNVPAVIPAGRARPRNYAANTHPFRASSHFLYLVGAPLEGAALFIDEGSSVLLVPDHDAHDHLWHGPTPSHAELTEQTGLPVQSMRALDALRGDRTLATIPPLDHAEAEHWARLLARPVDELGAHRSDEPLLEALVKLRLTHDEAAIDELRRAAEASVRAHLVGMGATRPGRHEREVCAEMEAVFARRGFGTAYNSIVSVHGEVLHNHHHHLRMEAGDLLLADVGAETDTGYAADITRTWPVSGKFTSSQRALYELVLEVQEACIAKVRPGTRYRDVHLTAARTLAEGLVRLGILRGEPDGLVERGIHALFLPHGIGHLLGLDVHDMEDLGDRAGYAPGLARDAQFGLSYLRLDRVLSPGMAVTIEPGFYQVPLLLSQPERVGLDGSVLNRQRLAAFADVRGIRIEDDVLITEHGNDVMTGGLAKEPAAIEEAMRA